MSSYQYELKNVYLGYEFEPSSSTLFYFPLKDDLLDKVWSTTIPISWTKQTIWYSFNTVWASTPNPSFWNSNFWFVSVRVKWLWNSSSSLIQQTINTAKWDTQYNFNHTNNVYLKYFACHDSWWTWHAFGTQQNVSHNVWHHFAYWYNWSGSVAYIDWQLIWTYAQTPYASSAWTFWNSMNVVYSEIIWETIARSEDKILSYYNATKSLYWITN